MSSPAFELANYLGGQGIGSPGSETDWGIFVGKEPPNPDSVITLYDTGGSAPLLYDENLRRPTIQVRVRSFNYLDAVAKQEAAFGVLNKVIGQVIGDHQYLGVWMLSDIISIGRDDNDRYLLTANYQIERAAA